MTAPTLDELRTDYDTLMKGLKEEKRWRERVFPEGDARRAAKLAEIDKMIAVTVKWKEALKPHCEPVYEQPALLDVPVEVKQERREEFR